MRAIFCGIIIFFVFSLSATVFTVSDEVVNDLQVVESTIEETVVKFTLSELDRQDHMIDQKTYSTLFLPHGGQMMEKGSPQLPFSQTSLIIPDAASMNINITNVEFKEYEMKIAPSKGLIRIGEDYEAIEYEFSAVYDIDEFFPEDIVTAAEPYLIRNVRGLDCRIFPVQYNPVRQIVRIYSEIEFEIYADGEGSVNISRAQDQEIKLTFNDIYSVHFDNYEQYLDTSRYDIISDTPGKELIVCYDDFAEAMIPYINWKCQKGIATEIVMISEIGSTGNELLAYLQDYYADDDELVWVLLVGDYPLIPVIYSYNTYAGDGFFARVAGSDPYADVIVGRFSAETAEEVDTMVERSVYHERDITGGEWLNKAAGCAYDGMGGGMHNEGGHEHMNYIRDDLLDYGYEVVDQIYEGTPGTTQALQDALNEGRGIMNYLGHGDITFYYSIPFDINEVNALENNHMLPVIHNCACLVGHFAGNDCFAEAWLKAENDEGPIGAVAFLGSAESQWIGVPEYGQDEWVDLLCEDSFRTVGGLWFNSISYAMEVTTEFSQLATWNLFGDPSLCMRSKEPEYMTVEHLPQLLIGMGEFQVNTGIPDALVCLSRDYEIKATGYTDAGGEVILDTSELEPIPGFLDLTVTALNKVAYMTEVQLIPAQGPFLYIDDYNVVSGDDNLLEPGETALLDLNICNYGSEEASDIYITMSIDDEMVTPLDSEEYISGLLSDESILLEDILSFQLDDEIGLGYPIQVVLNIDCLQDSWQKVIWFVTAAPAGIWVNPADFNFTLTAGDSLRSGISILNNLDETCEYSLRLEESLNRSIEGSFVNCDTEGFLPGQPWEWTFTAYNFSTDSEWISDISLSFPQQVNVTDINPFEGASGGSMETDDEAGIGVQINWHGSSPNGWGYLHDGESASTTVNLEIPYLETDSLTVEWQLTGDGYGQAPHQTSGSLDFINPLKWVELQNTCQVIPAGSFRVFDFLIQTQDMDCGEYDGSFVLFNGEDEQVIPLHLTINPAVNNSDDLVEPSHLSIHAYPNPFNPLVNVSYNVKSAGQICLKIYNVKGQLIETLEDSYKSPGLYNISWKADHKSSGIYFLSLKSDSETVNRKIVLLK